MSVGLRFAIREGRTVGAGRNNRVISKQINF
jgi:translation elongation factor EF-Tu-like GTPase